MRVLRSCLRVSFVPFPATLHEGSLDLAGCVQPPRNQHGDMLRSLRLPGLDEALADEVGLFDVLDMPIDSDVELGGADLVKTGGKAADSSVLVDTGSGKRTQGLITDAITPGSTMQ